MDNDSRDEYDKHIAYTKDKETSKVLSPLEYIEYISLLIFIGDDGRLWCKHGLKRVYYDRLGKYYDLIKRRWILK